MSPEELGRRWRTPQGERIRAQLLVDLLRPARELWDPALWESLYEGFPGAEEVPDGLDLRGIDLRDLQLGSVQGSGLVLDFARLDGWRLEAADLQLSSVAHASFRGARLEAAYFLGANARGAGFEYANLGRAILRSAHFAGASFRGATLTEADLSGSDFTGADFTGADLRNANLENANLWQADLSAANLAGAALHRAHFTEPPARQPPQQPASREEAELLALHERFVNPFYLGFLHGNRAGRDSIAVRWFRKRVRAVWDDITPARVECLLARQDWRPRLAGAWFCGLKGWGRFAELLGRYLVESRFCFAGQGYCFALASFADGPSADHLGRYLDTYLTQTEKYYDQHWALPALVWVDRRRGTNDSARYLGPGGPWDRWASARRREGAALLAENLRKFEAIMTGPLTRLRAG